MDRLWVVVGPPEILSRTLSRVARLPRGEPNLNTKHLATEALAKRDVARRLKTLATGLSLTSDKTWLMRRATHLEQDAARLERQASKAAGQTGDPI